MYREICIVLTIHSDILIIRYSVNSTFVFSKKKKKKYFKRHIYLY